MWMWKVKRFGIVTRPAIYQRHMYAALDQSVNLLSFSALKPQGTQTESAWISNSIQEVLALNSPWTQDHFLKWRKKSKISRSPLWNASTLLKSTSPLIFLARSFYNFSFQVCVMCDDCSQFFSYSHRKELPSNNLENLIKAIIKFGPRHHFRRLLVII